jgi:glutamate--cysteine ligase catalytic subunit
MILAFKDATVSAFSTVTAIVFPLIAFSANTPFFNGFLMNTDYRWNFLNMLDNRTAE